MENIRHFEGWWELDDEDYVRDCVEQCDECNFMGDAAFGKHGDSYYFIYEMKRRDFDSLDELIDFIRAGRKVWRQNAI